MSNFVTGSGNESADKKAVSAVDDKSRTGNGKRKGRLVVRVVEEGKPTVNIRIPLRLARLGIKFMPKEEKEELAAEGLDLEEILREVTEDESEPLVQIEEDGKSVYVAVE